MNIDNSQIKTTVFNYYDDESSAATEFRRLSRNIRHYGNPTEINSIMITSAMKHEGKSLIAANLAIAMAKRETDRQILLIDCDLRKPVIHTFFGLERTPGFAALLTPDEAMEPEEAACETKLTNLKVIPSGRVVGSPSNLLVNVKDVLDKCKRQFDILICDTPPVVPIDDAVMIAPHLDGVLLVVMAGKTDRMIVKRAVDILNDVKAKIIGIALNNVNKVMPYYYDYNHYGYKYEVKESKE